MKTARFLCGLILSVVLMGLLMLPQQVFAQTVVPGGGGTDSSSPVSARCQEILSAGALQDAARAVSDAASGIVGGSTSNTSTPDGSNELYVFLSESFTTPEGSTYSCSEVVECLRQKFRGQTARLRELNTFNEVKKNYSQCIVSGSDGLDLLSNYASRVYQWIAGIVGGICVLVIVISGIQISIGGLSQEEVSTAKDRVVRSLVGLVVLFLSAFILYTINPIFFT